MKSYSDKSYIRRTALLIIIILAAALVLSPWVYSGIITLSSSTKTELGYFDTIDELTAVWGAANKSTEAERGAIILSKKIDGNKVYYIKRTYVGEHDNIAQGFIASYLNYGFAALFGAHNMEGFIHTHPYLYENLPSNADGFLLYLPGINSGYIANASGEVREYEIKMSFIELVEKLFKAGGHGYYI